LRNWANRFASKSASISCIGVSTLSSHDLDYDADEFPVDGIRVMLRALLKLEEPAPLLSRL
jgi:hypothetical protein